MSLLPVIDSCNNCGACCLQQESPPGYLMILSMGEDFARSEAELERYRSLPVAVMAELKSYRERLLTGQGHPNDSVCIWFDEETRKCKHYDLRPDVCREEIAVGDEACLSWRELYSVKP